jgi:formylglycine-generating enzyme required for sulfatase activity
MHGNVWEWTQDLQGNFKNTRVRVGGAYTAEAHECAASQSYGYGAEGRSADQGFRVALVPAP